MYEDPPHTQACSEGNGEQATITTSPLMLDINMVKAEDHFGSLQDRSYLQWCKMFVVCVCGGGGREGGILSLIMAGRHKVGVWEYASLGKVTYLKIKF